jgi:hypothetical protein
MLKCLRTVAALLFSHCKSLRLDTKYIGLWYATFWAVTCWMLIIIRGFGLMRYLRGDEGLRLTGTAPFRTEASYRRKATALLFVKQLVVCAGYRFRSLS